jgi:hypothetical protein
LLALVGGSSIEEVLRGFEIEEVLRGFEPGGENGYLLYQ